MTRAHAREAAGPRKRRKGREQCTARRRDGQPCQAPAIKGGLVCRRHGGGSPQAQIAARHLILAEALWTAGREWEAARGTAREFDALCRFGAAQRELADYEAKLEYLADLKAEIKRLRMERT